MYVDPNAGNFPTAFFVTIIFLMVVVAVGFVINSNKTKNHTKQRSTKHMNEQNFQERPASVPLTEKKTLDERKAILAQQIQMAVARGGRIQSQSDSIVVIMHGKPVNHMLHLFITLITSGIWLIGWIIVAMKGGEKREMITVDEFGNVLTQEA